MDEAQDKTTTSNVERFRWMIEFAVAGDLKFISHHDTLRLFQRALARARLPIRFTQGFNPHPKMTMPLPRPVGVASEAECLVIETITDLDPNDLRDRLDRHTPDDMSIRTARRLGDREKPQPDWVRYRLEPAQGLVPKIDERIDRVLAAEVIEVERRKPGDGTVKTVDIRPYVMEIRTDGNAVEFALRVSERGTAKPAEIAALLGYDPDAINHEIRRMAVYWR